MVNYKLESGVERPSRALEFAGMEARSFPSALLLFREVLCVRTPKRRPFVWLDILPPRCPAEPWEVWGGVKTISEQVRVGMQSQDISFMQKPQNNMPPVRSGTQLDILEIVFAVIRKWWLVVVSMLLCGTIAFCYAAFKITPLYRTSAMVYVSNTNSSVVDTSRLNLSGVDMADLNVSSRLVRTYLVILRSRTTLERVIEKADLPYSYEALLGMISASAVDETEVFSITVTSPSPEEAEKIANTITDVLPEVISMVLEGSSTKIVDYAIIPGGKVSPNVTKYTLTGMLLGALLGVGIIVLTVLLDYKIHTEEYLAENFPDLPLLALVPDIGAESGKGYYSSRYYSRYSKYDSYEGKSKNSKRKDGRNEDSKRKDTDANRKKGSSKGKNGKKKGSSGGRLRMIGPNLNFAAKEAYKRLRANLIFSLSNVEGCRVIGVTSAMRGEGKSLTSVNLTYTLAEAGHRVLLVEGDMRLPTLAYKLRLSSKRGLSDLFSEDVKTQDLIQHHEMVGKAGKSGSDSGVVVGFDLLVAGTIPPNPSELLGSEKMQAVFGELKELYDYIVVDLPPVIAVSDALVASDLLDGLVFVVRHDYSEKGAVMEAMRQVDFSDAHVLGFVFNAVNEQKEGYAGKYRYRYGHKYYRGYRHYGYGHDYGGYERHEAQRPAEQLPDRVEHKE